MDYIILDLEWDSAYSKKHSRFVNQIIQIGAVKLDSKFNFVDSFKQTIVSSLKNKVTKRFTELTGITSEEMQEGISYKEAVENYNAWCGKNIITLTWSNSDLFTIVNNDELFLDKGKSLYLGKYADLQSFVQNELRLKGIEITNQISLSKAAEILGISTENLDLHTALDDSILSSHILKQTYNKARFKGYIKDTKNPEFYRKLTFKNHYITNITDKRITKKHLGFHCEKCNVLALPGKKWRYKNKWFTNDFCCPKCNSKFIGRVLFKVTYDGVKVSRRILYPVAKVEENANIVQ